MELCTWAPHVMENLSDADLNLYLEFSYSACIPGGPCTIDKALHILYLSNGDIMQALERLLKSSKDNSVNHHNTANWTEEEVSQFEKLIIKYGKNFSLISRDLKTKSPYQSIEFYYLWKCSSIRSIPHISPRSSHRQSRQHHNQLKVQLHQMAHARLSNAGVTNMSPQIDGNNNNSNLTEGQQSSGSPDSSEISIASSHTDEQFPCKVCGRVFLKIKSRSAHMKRHKNER